jgi:ribosomal protein L24
VKRYSIGFSLGDEVLIRYGQQQGKKAKIIKSQPPDIYKVRVEDGSVLFFSGKGLDRQKEAVLPSVVG